MRERVLARVAASGCGILMLVFLLGGARPVPRVAAQDPKPAPNAGDTFGTTKVWAVHLEIPAKEFDAMQPAFGGGFGGPPKKEEKKDDKKRDSEKNLFGTDFPWVE